MERLGELGKRPTRRPHDQHPPVCDPALKKAFLERRQQASADQRRFATPAGAHYGEKTMRFQLGQHPFDLCTTAEKNLCFVGLEGSQPWIGCGDVGRRAVHLHSSSRALQGLVERGQAWRGR